MVVLKMDSDDRLRSHDGAPPSAGGPMPMTPPTPPADEKPYHAKRPHRKSRLGCRNCKARKVKCDEKKPSCRNCSLRKESCLYPQPSHPSPAARSATASAAASSSASASAPDSASAVHSSSSSAAAPVPAPGARPIPTPPVSASAASPFSPRRVVPTGAPVSPSASSASPLSRRANVSPMASASFPLVQRSPLAPHAGSSRRGSHDASPANSEDGAELIIREPAFKFGGADEYDMKLLWFYTTETYSSFSVERDKLTYIDRILKSQIVKYAFQSPFLMDCILGLSALHMQAMHMPVPLSKAITYRARAFAGYRQAIERADPNDFPALLACSLLLCALSSELFREGDMKPLYIIDWMVVWRGIGLIFDIIPGDTLYESGLDRLFARPSFDLNQAALSIPSNLLFMVTSIKEGDDDYPYINAYYETLKFLGGLYLELESGFSPLLSLRVITWFTFLPKPFIELARAHRPRVLVILAHYLPFLKLIENVWWLVGISDRGVQDIIDHLGPEWHSMLNVPRTSTQTYDKVELAKLIRGNHAWEPSTDKAEDVPEMLLINDQGEEVSYDRERGWVPLFHGAGHSSWLPRRTAQLGGSEPGRGG